MNYIYDDEVKLFENDPDLRRIKENILSKPDGEIKFAGYINTRVKLKNDESRLVQLDTNDPSYLALKEDIERRRQIYWDVSGDLEAPLKPLEKIQNAKTTIAHDPFEKAIDIVKNYLNSEKDSDLVEDERESAKPSLWDVFWK